MLPPRYARRRPLGSSFGLLMAAPSFVGRRSLGNG